MTTYETNLVDSMEAMRFRDSGPQAGKILWITRNVEGKKMEGTKLDAVGSATRLDQGLPWAVFTGASTHPGTGMPAAYGLWSSIRPTNSR